MLNGMSCLFLVRLLLAGVCLPLAAFAQPPAAAGKAAAPGPMQFFTIGTGAITGVYYSVGESICKLVNRERSRHGLRCSVETTPATIHNLKALRKKDLSIALVQSDAEFAAQNGQEEFRAAGPDRELRAIALLHMELMTLVVQRGSGISTFEELRGKRVSIGSGNSGTRYSVEKVMQALEMRKDQFAKISTLKADEHSDALCKGRIDAFVFTVGHPTRNIVEAAAACPIDILPVNGSKVATLLAANPYYAAAVIPGGVYAGNPAPVETYGSRALLLTSASTSDAVVYETTRAIFENLQEFKSMHPALGDLEKARMVPRGAASPVHPAALRYYRENGLM